MWNALLDAVKGRNGNEIVKMQFPGNEQRCIDLMGVGGIKGIIMCYISSLSVFCQGKEQAFI